MTPLSPAARSRADLSARGGEVVTPLFIQIARHALPRPALGRADIGRRRVENGLPHPPLHIMRHAGEAAFEAGIGVAATRALPATPFVPAGAPQRKGVAIAPLLQGFFDGKALCICG